MTDLRLTLRSRKGSPLTSAEADADLQFLAQLSVPKWSAVDSALVGAYTNGIIVDSAATGKRFQLKTGGTPTVDPDTDGTQTHWTQVGSSSDSLFESRGTDPAGTAPTAGKLGAIFNGGLYTVQGGVYAPATGDSSPIDTTLAGDPTGTAPAAGKLAALVNGKLYTVVGGVYAELNPSNAQALIDAAENYIPINVGSNTRVGAVNPADWTAGTPGADDVIEYLYQNGSSDVFVHDGVNWGVTPIYTPRVETDEQITLDTGTFLYSSTPRQSDFDNWLVADQAGAQLAGSGDQLRAVTTEGHIFTCGVFTDKVTGNLITSAVEAIIPIGSPIQTLPVNFGDWAPDWIITTHQDTGDAPAGDYIMNTAGNAWLPTKRSSNYLGGGGSVNAGITQAELDAVMLNTIRKWEPGNQNTTIYVQILDGVTPVFQGNAFIRTGGDTTIDPTDLANGGPNNWRLDLNRITTWNAALGVYFDTSDTVEHNSGIYKALGGGTWSIAPSGTSDANWERLP